MRIECIQNVAECKAMWEEMSPRKSIYDEWDFRFCFYKYFNYALHYYAALSENKVIGLLPLQYDPQARHLDFFGGSYMDMNAIFMEDKYHEFIPAIYQSLTLPAKLIVTQNDPFTSRLPQVDFNYFFDVRGIGSHEELFERLFSKKTQRTFKAKNRKIEENGVMILKGRHDDMDVLIELNIKQFGDSSSFHFAHRMTIFRELLKLPFQFVMMSFLVNGKIQAVTFSIKYKNTYHYLASGVNPEIPNFGSYVIMKNIDEAARLNCDIFDMGPGDCGWKERWHAEKSMPQHIFSNTGPNLSGPDID